ncbi:UNVERIFIED_CONTAM: hypothetical protein PYX00_005629 [Menopon gallinae]|uniref:Polypeptide N-acetylgalactosaminyltransferase n=1 Tax=Menopon gallinae TaxID=328185 RepID=A0AAW2HU02_9NEOP
MRRNFKGCLKFLVLTILTVIATIFIFRLVRHPDFKNKGLKKVFGPESNAWVDQQLKLGGKKDWHNYVLIEQDLKRTGLGEQGKPAFLSKEDDKKKDALYSANGFNALLSDKISLNRSVPDIRHPGCKTKTYYRKLNSVSVIVPFHNEHWSTLLRTVYSVLNRSPPQLLKEIILVDDFSSKSFLKNELDEYVKKNLPKVKIIRQPERLGLIRARLAGAKVAIAEVLVFLDSHTEANVNWLPPLLEPIALDYRTCVCPFIDVIAYDTFEYRSQDEGQRGAFDWEFFYKRLPLLPEDLEHPTEPFKSPVMAGGLFAISAKFFWELGGYDEGLFIWGGEQYELSFKIWQCGGQMVDAPCSRVGHIYRKFAPFPNPGKGDFVGKNYRRVAEVWMDEYAEYLYKRRPHYRDIDPGDLTAQRAIREKLHCKPFKWFMENVAFDLPLKYPPIEPPDFGEGEIRSIANKKLCVDTEMKNPEIPFGLKQCVKGKRKKQRSEQNFKLTWHKDIRPAGRSMCWDVASLDEKAPVNLFSCHGMKGNQLWRYDMRNKWLVHGGNPRCLTADLEAKTIYVTTCDPDLVTQKWEVEKINQEAMEKWDSIGPK